MKHLFLIVLLSLTAIALAQTPPDVAVDVDSLIQHDLTMDHELEELQLLVTPLTLEQLSKEAEEWEGYVQAAMARVASLKVAAQSAEGERLDRIHEEINESATERANLVAKFELIIDSMELKGADPELVSKYRNYLSGALAGELQATDARTMLSELIDWATSRDGGIGFLLKATMIIGALIALLIVARLVASLLGRGLQRVSKLSQLMQDFLIKAMFWLLFATGLMVILSLFGVNITPLFAVLGGASFILAFAMQETLGNLASGLMIMINKPFDVGDLIDTNGILGEVQAVSIVSTTIRTLDNQIVILPNSKVWGSIITNVTVSPNRRVDMVFGIGYGDDMDKAEEILQQLVARHPLILADPEANIRVHELADSSVNLICRPWVKTEDYWTVYWDLTKQAKEAFDRSGISIPFPQRDVHLYSEDS